MNCKCDETVRLTVRNTSKRDILFNVQNTITQVSIETTQAQINAVGKGGLPLLKIQLIQRLDQSTLERGQAALPNCIYLCLSGASVS